MSEPPQTVPDPDAPAGGERRRLDRAPGDRYAGARAGPDTTAGTDGDPVARRGVARAVVVGVLVVDAGAVLFFVLGLLDLGIGLVVVAAFVGWVTALALVWSGRDGIPVARARMAIAAFLGGWAVVAGILLDWVFALLQGGVLGPLDYVAERYGLVALLSVIVAAGVAAVRAR